VSDGTERDGESIGTGLRAAVKVALSNTANTFIRPVHAAKVLLGIEKEKTIREMLRDEERRISDRRSTRGQSGDKPSPSVGAST
jgi:hypothetical protein